MQLAGLRCVCQSSSVGEDDIHGSGTQCMFVIICGRCLVVITHVCILSDLYMMSCTGDTTVSRLVDSSRDVSVAIDGRHSVSLAP